MARTQAQREQELQQRKQQVSQELAEAQLRLVTGEKALRNKYFPSEEKFKPWALAARAADPKRPIDAKEFMKDFYRDLMKFVKDNKKELNLGNDTIRGWEEWFLGLDAEDLAELEEQIDAASLPLEVIQAS